MNKRVTYYPESSDLLRRYYTLADLQDFVEGIVKDNPGTRPDDITLRIDGGLSAELLVKP